LGSPCAESGEIVAVRDMERAEMLAQAFVKMHSSNNRTEESIRKELDVLHHEVPSQRHCNGENIGHLQ
jgi:hypothetical protein